MNELNNCNGKKRKTEDIQRGNKNCELQGDTGSLGSSTSSSREYEFDEISADRADCERTNSSRSFCFRDSQNAILGGILCQLITQTRNQVAHYHGDIKRLEDQIEELEKQIDEWQRLLEAVEKTFIEPQSEN